MSEAREFQVGDEVEVLPAPEEAAWDWQRVSGLRGRIEASRGPELIPGVLVAFGEGVDRLWWWCDPAWLRLAPSPRQDAAQIAQDDWSIGEPPDVSCFMPDVHLGPLPRSYHGVGLNDNRDMPSEREPGVWTFHYPISLPNFNVGDTVRYRGNEQLRTVSEVSVTPRYRLDGGETWVREEDLRAAPAEPAAPVVCATDGTRCASWRSLIEPARIFVGATQVNQDAFRVCPWCGERLRKEA